MFLVIWALLCGHGSSVSASSVARAPGPVLLLGVDGMSFDVLEPLVDAGRLPNFKVLMNKGARAVLRSERPMRSPALWTTIATGQPRGVHRIFDFVTGSPYWPKNERSEGQELVTSDMRRAPALWNWAQRAKKTSAVVGWLNTWPAEAVQGVMVAPYVALGSSRQTSIKGKIYRDADAQYYPQDARERLQRLVVAAAEVTAEQIARLVQSPPKHSPLHAAVPKLKRYLYTVRWSIAATLTNTALLEHELQRGSVDLAMTYFDGADTLAHRFWLMRQPVLEIQARLEAHGLDPELASELKQRLGGVIDGYYELVDAMLGRLLLAAGPHTTVVVVSDHGWGSLQGSDRAPYDHVPFDGEHRLEGVWLSKGAAIVPGSYPPLTLYDVAPTVLSLMGLPRPEEMPGRVAKEMLREELLASSDPLAFATHPSKKRKPQRKAQENNDAHFREVEIERLRSLGYVQ